MELQYKLLSIDGNQNWVVRNDGLHIPFDVNNIDYLHYLKWLDGYELQGMDWVKTSNGNTPLPADE